MENMTKKGQEKYYNQLIENKAWKKLTKIKKTCNRCGKNYSFKEYFMSYSPNHSFIQDRLISLGSAFERGSRCPDCRNFNSNRKKFFSIDQALIYYLKKKDKEIGAKVDNDWWWASELGLCKRRQFLRRKGVTNIDEKEERIRFLGQAGYANHRWIEEALTKLGILESRETRIRDEKTRYSGRFDALLWLNGKLVVADIKTQRAEAFFYRSKKGGQIKEFQKLQLFSYYHFLKKRYPELSEARLFFLDRSGGCRDEYVFQVEKKDEKKVTDTLRALNKYWKKDEMPPKVDKKEKWQCRYCPYKTYCKGLEKEKNKI